LIAQPLRIANRFPLPTTFSRRLLPTHFTLRMRWLLRFSLLAAHVVVTFAKVRSFIDDTGRIFDFEDKPRIAVRAGVGALSLYHFGLPTEQLAAIWGLWFVRGSDFDIFNPEAGSIYPDADPTPDEIEYLRSAINLSPDCYEKNNLCFQWDDTNDVAALKDEIDYIIYIDNGQDEQMQTAEDDTGIPVVFVDTWFEYNPNCRSDDFSLSGQNEACIGRSMIDIAQKIQALAFALGADTTKADKHKIEACDAAADFTNAMRVAQDKGIRIKGTTFGLGKDFRGRDTVAVRDLDPLRLWALRTMEELGAPMLHGTSEFIDADAYFLGCAPGRVSEDCNEQTLLPVDFWIVDTRSYQVVLSENFRKIFPDQAILAGQHWYYARNDGAVSYQSITKMLNALTKKISQAKQIHPDTLCKDNDPKDPKIIRYGNGLEQNDYICYNRDYIQKEYLTCFATQNTGGDSSSDSTLTILIIAGFSALILTIICVCIITNLNLKVVQNLFGKVDPSVAPNYIESRQIEDEPQHSGRLSRTVLNLRMKDASTVSRLSRDDSENDCETPEK